MFTMNPGPSQPKSKQIRLKNAVENVYPVKKNAEQNFIGLFTGLSVEVFNPEDIKGLHENGFYGIGSLTKSQPRILNNSKRFEYITESQFERRKSLKEKLGCQQLPDVKVNVKTYQENKDEFEERINPFQIEESLVLSLEESFFLQNVLKCLQINQLNDETELSPENFLNICCSLEKNFVIRYIAYHYYRRKNWVVKSGLKFGGDFGKLKFQ